MKLKNVTVQVGRETLRTGKLKWPVSVQALRIDAEGARIRVYVSDTRWVNKPRVKLATIRKECASLGVPHKHNSRLTRIQTVGAHIVH
jgi:hypothetical protein